MNGTSIGTVFRFLRTNDKLGVCYFLVAVYRKTLPLYMCTPRE